MSERDESTRSTTGTTSITDITGGTGGTAPAEAGRIGIDDLLEQIRSGLDRIGPRAAYEAYEAGDALLVDTRYAALRERDGLIPGALVVERNELEWRLDPWAAIGRRRRTAMICGWWSSATRAMPLPSPPSPCAAWACTGRPT